MTSSKAGSIQTPITLLYDKECPACDNYCRWVTIREDLGEFVLLDAREPSALLAAVTARGWDIDQGMVLQLGEQLYYGADAIQALALISSRSSLFNRLNYWLFKSPRLAHWLYPLLRSLRNLLLKLLRKSKINNLHKSGNTRF